MAMEKFFKDSRLPFAECRYSRSCVQKFKPHMHRAFSLGAVQRGEVEYQAGRERALLTVGSLALINPETLHSCNCRDERGRSFYMLYLDPNWCLELQQSLWQVDCFMPSPLLRLDDHQLYQQYCRTMDVLMDIEIELLHKEQLLHELVGAVFERVFSGNGRPVGENLAEGVEKMKELLGSELKMELTLAELAAELNQNQFTLLRKFKVVTGLTPHAYRTNCRIDLARKLLQEGMDISEVALECGFFDQSHLHRHFKAMTAVTPQQYRINFIQE